MKLLVLNPNASQPMTEAIAAAAREAAAPATSIVARTASFGPVSIEGHFDETFGAAGVAEQAHRAAGENFDAAVIACFGDPGLDAAREVLSGPVLGIAEAAFHAATFVATGFSVVTTMTRTCVIAERLVRRYGFERQCRGIHGTDIPVLALEACGDDVIAQIEDAARAALAQDRSEAIVLGCAGMTRLTRTLQRRLDVPVIDGVAVAVKFAEALVALGLAPSKRSDYASPLPKRWTGWTEAFSG